MSLGGKSRGSSEAKVLSGGKEKNLKNDKKSFFGEKRRKDKNEEDAEHLSSI